MSPTTTNSATALKQLPATQTWQIAPNAIVTVRRVNQPGKKAGEALQRFVAIAATNRVGLEQ